MCFFNCNQLLLLQLFITIGMVVTWFKEGDEYSTIHPCPHHTMLGIALRIPAIPSKQYSQKDRCLHHPACVQGDCYIKDVLNLVYMWISCVWPVPKVLQTDHPDTAVEYSEATSKCTFPEWANCGIKKLNGKGSNPSKPPWLTHTWKQNQFFWRPSLGIISNRETPPAPDTLIKNLTY